jgi:glutamate formiminotransferase
MRIVQCVPNFSEGKDLAKVEEIVSVLKNKEGFNLVSYEPDKDYNRTVVTLLGDPDKIIDALIPFTGKCLELIDMNFQTGEHSRMGAVDVIPFIPIQDVTMEECIVFANTIAQKINEEYDIPIFMYAEAANVKSRIKLPAIRKGEFEGMKEKIKLEKWKPDYGKAEIHPTFGVIGVGARIPLIAYNIDLEDSDTKRAGSIARSIRFSSGGYRHVQAGPVYLDSRGHTQVTMNILNYMKNPIYRILETVKMEAKRYNINVPSCELVGLIPKKALISSLKYYMACEGKTLGDDLSLEEITKLSIQYIGFRDFDIKKIIEANI